MTFHDDELDALAEIINIGAGRAAASLSEMTGSRIELSIPGLYTCESSGFSEIAGKLDSTLDTTLQQGFAGDVSGQAILAFPEKDAAELERIVGGIMTEDAEMDMDVECVLEEIGNIVLNAVLGSISNILEGSLTYTLPKLCTKTAVTKAIFMCKNDAEIRDSLVLIADTNFDIASRNVSGSLILVF
ncbi:MAG: chemotaxis protein CheX, partial [Planctomycetes bacterium]|nr:chemotaxis protein CheX [Planctomycetota bacterium]